LEPPANTPRTPASGSSFSQAVNSGRGRIDHTARL
jgi:hypothetical protein